MLSISHWGLFRSAAFTNLDITYVAYFDKDYGWCWESTHCYTLA